MASVQSTPRDKNKLTRTPRRLCKTANLAPPETPECFNAVHIETPTVLRKRTSKNSLDELSNLTVAVRIRPLSKTDLNCTTIYNAVSMKENDIIVKTTSSGNFGINLNHTFHYDHIFDSECNQNDVFINLGIPMLDSAFRGYNACLFAYGQTGSGKSYSMMGENIDTYNDKLNDAAGIIPRFCYELFERITALPETSISCIEVSYFEIYNEKIHDLLSMSASNNERLALKVREHPVWGPYVVNLSQHTVKSFTELQNWLKMGDKNRATAATAMNEKSSRSHSIFTIELSLSEMNNTDNDLGRRSKISLVDLAGSERLNSSNVNDEHHRQSVSINRSLLTLGKVIAALAEQKKNIFVPYRDSILTWLLRESLGGNSLTSMLATISPASSNAEETLATLRYACQARSIVNRARINEDPHDRLIRELRAEVERLRALRQDYEQKSVPSSYIPTQEHEELRIRLTEMEQNLNDAEKVWEKKFLEAKQKQLEQLAKAEREKAELESNLRVISNLDKSVSLTPYKSNFVDELEAILRDDEICDSTDTEDIMIKTQRWCDKHNLPLLHFKFDNVTNKVCIKNLMNNTFAYCDLKHLENRFSYNQSPESFLDCLEWEETINILNNPNTYLLQIRIASENLNRFTGDEYVKKAYSQFNIALKNLENVMTGINFDTT